MAGHSSDMPPPQYNSALMQQIHPTSPMFSPCGSVSQPQQHQQQQQQQQATTPQAMSATFTPHGLPTPLWSPTGVPQMLHSPLPLDPSLQSAGPPRPASTSAVNNQKLQAQSPTKRTTKLGRPPKSEAQKAADAAAKKAARKEKEPRQVRLPELLKASKKGSGNGANPKGRPPKSHQQQLQAPANPTIEKSAQLPPQPQGAQPEGYRFYSLEEHTPPPESDLSKSRKRKHAATLDTASASDAAQALKLSSGAAVQRLISPPLSSAGSETTSTPPLASPLASSAGSSSISPLELSIDPVTGRAALRGSSDGSQSSASVAKSTSPAPSSVTPSSSSNDLAKSCGEATSRKMTRAELPGLGRVIMDHSTLISRLSQAGKSAQDDQGTALPAPAMMCKSFSAPSLSELPGNPLSMQTDRAQRLQKWLTADWHGAEESEHEQQQSKPERPRLSPAPSSGPGEEEPRFTQGCKSIKPLRTSSSNPMFDPTAIEVDQSNRKQPGFQLEFSLPNSPPPTARTSSPPQPMLAPPAPVTSGSAQLACCAGVTARAKKSTTTCSRCDQAYHLRCIGLSKASDVPASWVCNPCEVREHQQQGEAQQQAQASTSSSSPVAPPQPTLVHTSPYVGAPSVEDPLPPPDWSLAPSPEPQRSFSPAFNASARHKGNHRRVSSGVWQSFFGTPRAGAASAGDGLLASPKTPSMMPPTKRARLATSSYDDPSSRDHDIFAAPDLSDLYPGLSTPGRAPADKDTSFDLGTFNTPGSTFASRRRSTPSHFLMTSPQTPASPLNSKSTAQEFLKDLQNQPDTASGGSSSNGRFSHSHYAMFSPSVGLSPAVGFESPVGSRKPRAFGLGPPPVVRSASGLGIGIEEDEECDD